MSDELDDDLEEDEEDGEEEPAGQSKKKLIIIIAIAVTVLLIGGGVGAMLMMSGGDDATTAETEEAGEPGAADEEGGEPKPVPPEKMEKLTGVYAENIYVLEPFFITLSGQDGTTHLKAAMELEYDTEDVMLELEDRLPQLRDSVLIHLSGKRPKEVNSSSGKITLKYELIDLINKDLTVGKIKTLYITEFIIQKETEVLQ